MHGPKRMALPHSYCDVLEMRWERHRKLSVVQSVLTAPAVLCSKVEMRWIRSVLWVINTA